VALNANWVRRLLSLDQQLGGENPPRVADVRVVQRQPYFSSREQAPVGWQLSSAAAAGATTHNGWILSASDVQGGKARCLIHRIAGVGSSNFLLGIAPQASLTYASGPTAQTPAFRDVDPDLAPLVSIFTIASAQLPASGTPGWAHPLPLDSVACRGSEEISLFEFIAPDRVCILIDNSPNTATSIRAVWQAVRI
jgi:hypothetical protein